MNNLLYKHFLQGGYVNCYKSTLKGSPLLANEYTDDIQTQMEQETFGYYAICHNSSILKLITKKILYSYSIVNSSIAWNPLYSIFFKLQEEIRFEKLINQSYFKILEHDIKGKPYKIINFLDIKSNVNGFDGVHAYIKNDVNEIVVNFLKDKDFEISEIETFVLKEQLFDTVINDLITKTNAQFNDECALFLVKLWGLQGSAFSENLMMFKNTASNY
jgi:hypothetical protein